MADYEKLMMEPALRQLDGKMNYKILAQDLGLGNDANAAKKANMRWLRFCAKLIKSRAGSPAAITGSKRVSPEHTPISGSPTKKSKIKATNSDDLEGKQIKTEKGTSVVETPTRWGPETQAGAIMLKNNASEDGLEYKFPNLEGLFQWADGV